MTSSYVDTRYATFNNAVENQLNLTVNRESTTPFPASFVPKLSWETFDSKDYIGYASLFRGRFLEPEPRLLERHEASAHGRNNRVD